MHLAFLQYNPRYLEVEANLDQVEALIEGLETDLLVLPELFASGYFFHDRQDVERVAEPIPEGPTTQRMLNWARTLSATLVGGLPERADNGAIYNSAVVVSPAGYVGTYRKTHLFYEEKLYFQPGDTGFLTCSLQTATGESYVLGVMICFDWYFPEAARTLALCGADIIAHPSNLVRKDCPRAMPIRALENHVYTVTANRIGEESNGHETLTFIGQSLICSPEGEVLVKASPDSVEIGRTTADPARARQRQITRYNDLFQDRRPGHYYRCSGSR